MRYSTVNGGTTRDYGYAYDGQCMFGLGDAGRLFTFDPITGSSPCGKTRTTIPLDAPAFYCDGKPGHVRAYDAVALTDIDLSTIDFARTSVTLTSDLGVGLGTFGFDPVSGRADISALPLSNTPMIATINLAVLNTSSFAGPDQPRGVVSFVGDAPQICFKTTVLTNCSVTSVSNQATATFTNASGTTNASSPTVTLAVDASGSSGGSTAPACTGEVHNPPATPTRGRVIALTG